VEIVQREQLHADHEVIWHVVLIFSDRRRSEARWCSVHASLPIGANLLICACFKCTFPWTRQIQSLVPFWHALAVGVADNVRRGIATGHAWLLTRGVQLMQ
jgi:hypothetical protein